LRLAITGIEDDQLDRLSRRVERLLECRGRDELRAAIGSLKEQPVRGPAGCVLPAMTAEVDHRRLDPAQLAEQIERLCRPSGHELEGATEAAALQLHLDRARLSIER